MPNTICLEGSNLGLFVVRNVKWPPIKVYITTLPTSSKHILIIIFCRVAGNIVPRVFLFSAAILGNEKPWGRGWRRQFDD